MPMAVFEPLFKALNDAGVRYVVVGGLPVVLHGHARLKRLTGRPQDQADIEQLEAILKAQEKSKMTERAESSDRWDATWEGARKQLLESALAATPAQRLAWLEEVLDLAHRAGALGPKPTRGQV